MVVVLEMSAWARAWLPALWAVKMEGLEEGRGRPRVLVLVVEGEVARREVRVEVKVGLKGREGAEVVDVGVMFCGVDGVILRGLR